MDLCFEAVRQFLPLWEIFFTIIEMRQDRVPELSFEGLPQERRKKTEWSSAGSFCWKALREAKAKSKALKLSSDDWISCFNR